MENSLKFLYTVFYIVIFLYFVAAIISAMFVIPLQLREVGIKNGLAKLRKQMLAKGFLSLVIAILSISALSTRLFIQDIDISRYIITLVLLNHAIGTLGKAIIDYQIYHQQYSDKNIEIHKRIDRLETGDMKREANKARAAHRKLP